MPPFTLLGAKRLLRFHGPCLKVLPYCQAMCCREWDAELSKEEIKSGGYLVEALRTKTRDGQRVRFLRKRKNKACVYLKPDNRCSIYPRRPGVCRDFTCRTGWKLSSADPGRLKASSEKKIRNSSLKRFMETITPDARFTPSRDVRLKLCYYQPEKKKIFFIKHRIKSRGNAVTHSYLPACRLNEGDILSLLSLFTRKNTLSAVRNRFKKGLSLRKIAEFAWLFVTHGILRPLPR